MSAFVDIGGHRETNPMYFARQNARTIVQYTTAYPFRLPENSMVCVFCCEDYPDPDRFRKHMDDAHKDFRLSIAFAHVTDNFIKVDCTDLRCRVCNDRFDNVQAAAEHIDSVHGKRIHFDYEYGLQPFRVRADLLLCSICGYKAFHLRELSRHMQTHYLQCTCDACGKSYSTSSALQNHIKKTCHAAIKQHSCRKCKRNFDTQDGLKQHFEDSKICCQHICNVCGERFGYWRIKQKHMEETHGVPKKQYQCLECEMIFSKPYLLRNHFKIVHTSDHWTCVDCGRKFDREYTLNRHMIIHTGEKTFTCSVCSKSFNRKSTLTQHMWIHSEIKKHNCILCHKQFNQRVSWKIHMKTRHPDMYKF